MKTEVYSWRVAAQKKSDLESEARLEGTSLAGLLEQITAEWLHERRSSRNGDEAEQAAIRRRAASAIGSVSGNDPSRSERTSRLVREGLRKRYGR
ncbi:MAG TPA: hypothetical protein VMI10_09360 [Terriglobales bacterium]|nr:hypothetical protein [Terriglobales bacterium]